MRVPDTGQPLFERRIVREGKRLAERMLAGYRVTANGRFVPEKRERGPAAWIGGARTAIAALAGAIKAAAKA